ncbi:MAG TPA: cytochrome C biogenesis protein [Bdellovibrionales bacterium]|nr:MAG: cytochrome C biogenesis protein [Bdellovibrionales bacterium GWB1_52_6]OFZ03899.1 MAG: cytochrome C biogenesis protein [Bdellovibrionales bacterium GWA1_52_35]OFZ37393.1 MAG: cytochrome C biogenesis protein [Bdellovibrionales bacterium GWC1_52_8]HAR42729.1 cytochrome C biogenesis protein [Bdellovibrionales bacterium]HCM39663.1 cytochrome C biogenesis protein [Bdellovibrionales bacterium]
MIALGTALWLGILTSISPCPLATNIAAVSYISKQFSQSRALLISGFLYAMGRTLTYLTLGVVLVGGLLSMPQVSSLLQKYMNQVLGPVLVLAGVFLLDLVELPSIGFSAGERLKERLSSSGGTGAFFLGSLFALSFCPVSAALFFGSLIPLALASDSSVLLPSIYGLGTAAPVVVFAILLGKGTQVVGDAFKKVMRLEVWVRRITGGVFVGVGMYYSLVYIFRVI